MDQIKIGKFIAERRKQNNLTQIQLADKLGITDRAVSKWENGKTMPDSSLMLELCDNLGITVNDLLNGEVVSAEDYNKKLEEQLMEIVMQKEHADKKLSSLVKCIYIADLIFYIGGYLLMLTVNVSIGWVIAFGAFILILSTFLTFTAFTLDYYTGYYQCKKCGHIYIPPFKSVFNSFTWNGRSFYFRCQHCRQRAWHKKVIHKD